MKIRRLGAVDAVQIDVNGKAVLVKRGEVIDVPAAVAGRPPEARVKACEAELVAATAAQDHDAASALRAEWGQLDHGAGLLAQADCWQPATAKADEEE